MPIATFPSIPTDNLYKFAALSGVAIVLVTVYSHHTFFTDLEARMSDTSEAMAIAKVHIDAARQKGKEVPKHENLDTQEKLEDAQDKLQEDLSGETAKLEARYKNYETQLDRQIGRERFDLFLEGFGSLLASSGFILWYLRVQRLLDRKLKKEVDALDATEDSSEQPQEHSDVAGDA